MIDACDGCCNGVTHVEGFAVVVVVTVYFPSFTVVVDTLVVVPEYLVVVPAYTVLVVVPAHCVSVIVVFGPGFDTVTVVTDPYSVTVLVQPEFLFCTGSG
jgi:hypothetical protein